MRQVAASSPVFNTNISYYGLAGRVLRFEIKTKWWLMCPADQNWLGKLILDHVETQKQKVCAINAIFEENLLICCWGFKGTATLDAPKT